TTARKPVENAVVPAVATSAPSEPLLALPLDAQTLLVRWPASASGAAGERLELEVTSDGRPERTVPVAARSRHAYVRSLSAGPVYRARLVARSPDGRRRVIGLPSRPVVFFPQASAFRTAERFVQYAWAEPAASAQSAGEAAPGAPLPPDAELAVLGLTRSAGGSATSPSGSTAGPVLGWLVSSRRPTSFAN